MQSGITINNTVARKYGKLSVAHSVFRVTSDSGYRIILNVPEGYRPSVDTYVMIIGICGTSYYESAIAYAENGNIVINKTTGLNSGTYLMIGEWNSN